MAIVALAAALVSASPSTGATPRPFPIPGGAPGSHPAPSPPAMPDRPADPATPDEGLRTPGGPPPLPAGPIDGYALAGTALSLRGIPYVNGGSDPSGFDCSGFTQYVFARYGLALPREVREQYRVGKSVKAEELAPGDMLFFSTTEPGPSHVGIALGGDQFVHAPSSTGVVRV